MGARARRALLAVGLVLFEVACSSRAERVAAPAAASNADAPQQPVLAGHVLGPDGKPVAEALVSVSSHFDVQNREPAYYETRSDTDGRFIFASLPAGTYGITATFVDGAAGYGGTFDVRPASPVAGVAKVAVPDVVLRLAGPSLTFRGLVQDESGSPVTAARVLAAAFSENVGEVYVAFSDPQGRYVLPVPSGQRYMLVADAAPRPRAFHMVEPVSRELDFRLASPPAPRPSDDAIAVWLKESATPLAVDTQLDARAAKAIGDVVGNAHVVGLGEAAHGTGTFTRLRYRVFQALVRDKGFRVFAVETSWADALVLEDYVLNGKRDVRSAFRAQAGRGETEEMLELVEWMRAYNGDPRHVDKLHFVGFDVLSNRAVSELLTYLSQVDAPAVAAAARTLEPLAAPLANETFGVLPKAQREETQRALTDLIARFEANRALYVSRSSNDAWLRARSFARAIERTAIASGDEFARDEQMFDTLLEVISNFPPGTGVLVNAHNGHVAAEQHIFYHMGVLARRRWGAGSVAIGTAFSEGSLYSSDYTNGPTNTKTIVRTARAPLGTLDGDLSLARLPGLVVDLRATLGAVAAWLRSPQQVRYHGSRFYGDAASFEPFTPAAAYDAIIYLDQVTAEHPLAQGSAPSSSTTPGRTGAATPGH